jgi:predicted transcriptional regulator
MLDSQGVELGQEADEVLQSAAEAIHRPRHDHVELALCASRQSASNAGRSEQF